MIGKFLTDPVWWFFLFWLPQYFHSRFGLDLTHMGPPLVDGVCGLDDWQRLRRMAAEGLYPPGHDAESGAACGDAYLCMLCFAGCDGWQPRLRVDRSWAAFSGSGRAPGLVGEYLYDGVGHVSVGARRDGGEFRAGGRRAWRSNLPADSGRRSATRDEMHTQSGFVPLFIYSGCAYLIALVLLRTLAPGLKRARTGRATDDPDIADDFEHSRTGWRDHSHESDGDCSAFIQWRPICGYEDRDARILTHCSWAMQKLLKTGMIRSKRA